MVRRSGSRSGGQGRGSLTGVKVWGRGSRSGGGGLRSGELGSDGRWCLVGGEVGDN